MYGAPKCANCQQEIRDLLSKNPKGRCELKEALHASSAHIFCQSHSSTDGREIGSGGFMWERLMMIWGTLGHQGTSEILGSDRHLLGTAGELREGTPSRRCHLQAGIFFHRPNIVWHRYTGPFMQPQLMSSFWEPAPGRSVGA